MSNTAAANKAHLNARRDIVQNPHMRNLRLLQVSCEEYDPVKNAWFHRPDARSARYHFATASEPDGHVFVAGGFGTRLGLSRAAYGTEAVLDDFERYDPHTGIWVRKVG